MIYSGLVSISFRTLAPEDIIDLTRRAGLNGIEWGGDIHVPHGDTARAARVRDMTLDAGLSLPSYGSYYRVAEPETLKNPAFEAVLKSAAALGTPVIRVWAGGRGSATADESYRQAVIADSRRIADMAAGEGIRVAYEYHGGTLTDDADSALALMEKAAHDNLGCYWQPPSSIVGDAAVRGLEMIIPWLENVHVFHWPRPSVRRPLAEGEASWKRYLEIIAAVSGDRYAMLEFVMNDDPEQCVADAATLCSWLDGVNIG